MLSSHEATGTKLCAYPGCPLDADTRSSFCREHVGNPSERRLALAARVRRLRDGGHTHKEVAALLGISRSYASQLDTDPDGAQAAARKDGYRRPCPDCGTLMDGSNGLGKDAPERCADCAAYLQHAERHWTVETIVAAFKRFHEVNGRAPATVDRMIHNPTIRAKLSTERIADGESSLSNAELPLPAIVNRECGSWTNALRLAGLAANPVGGPGHRTSRRPQRSAMKDYIVFASSDGDNWQEIGQAAARTPADAIAQIAGSTDLEYAAIPTAMWAPVRVKPVTRFEVVSAA